MEVRRSKCYESEAQSEVDLEAISRSGSRRRELEKGGVGSFRVPGIELGAESGRPRYDRSMLEMDFLMTIL